MRDLTRVLAMAAIVALGCRSTEEVGGTHGASVTQTRAPDAEATDPSERRVPHPDDADRWQRKEIDRYGRQQGRRQAAEERDRRIDEAPIKHPPDTPPAGEPPPK